MFDSRGLECRGLATTMLEGIQRAELGRGDGVECRTSDTALSRSREISGPILHGGAYVNATPFKGQRVLVVGMGNTGAEIALDLCEHGGETTISMRGGVHIS